MWRKALIAVAAGTLTLSLSGCFAMKFNLETEQADAAQMTPHKNARTVKRVTESKLVWYLLDGLIPLGNADMTGMLKPHLEGGKRLANMRIHTITWFDIYLITLTGITVEGDVVVPR